MEAISAYPTTPGYSLTRLLLAGSSARSAILSGAHAENSDRVERASRVRPRPPGSQPSRPSDVPGRQSSGDSSPYGPAAIFEPSDHARETVLRPERGQPQPGEAKPQSGSAFGQRELTEEEQKQAEELKQRDQEVRRHEQAHKAAAGSYASGGPTFEYTTGPDGKRYAVGGEVPIDLSPVDGNPKATIAKMQQIRRAALAPADPSSADRSVAAQAAQAERKAREELNGEKVEPNGSAGAIGHSAGGPASRGSGYGSALPGQLLDVTV